MTEVSVRKNDMEAAEKSRPADVGELQEAIRDAGEAEASLRIRGMDSKRQWASAARIHSQDRQERVLDMGGFNGIDLYEAEELVLRAAAATPLKDINTQLQAKQQQLAFEPPNIAPLYGGDAAAGTLGGVIACNLSGPRRVRSGAARDCVLGIEAVSGRGEVFHSGGRVMKNVTGYDLPKLLTGSHGSLAAITRITMKVLPACEAVATLLLPKLEPEAAVGVMTMALSSPYDVSAAAYLPAPVAAAAHATSDAITVLRLEGAEESLPARVELLQALLKTHGDVSVLPDGESRALWSFIGDASFFAAAEHREDMLWRLFLPPARGHRVAELARQLGDAPYFLDWGGGLAWLSLPSALGDVRALGKQIADFALEQGGYGIAVRGAEEYHDAFGGFASLGAAEAVLMERVRLAFDPKGVFASR